MEVYGVFEGGGVRGTALIGAVAAIEERQITFRAVAGTSAGAIVASLIAAGYSASEMQTLMLEKDLRDFKDPISNIPGLRWIRAWHRLGLYRGDEFQRWIAEKISRKLTRRLHASPRFEDLPKPLTLIATDVVRQQAKVFSRERTPDIAVADAVRMSMSIPFFFCPVRYGSELLVDGGTLSNFPAWAFDEQLKAVPLPVLGLRLQPDDIPPRKINNFLDLAVSIINTVVRASIPLQITHVPNLHVIDLPTLGVHTTDFDISNEIKNRLYESGYQTARAYLATSELTTSVKLSTQSSQPLTALKVIMFADQVASTFNVSRRTHTEVREVTRQQDALVYEVLGLARGKLLKEMGDSYLAEFPAVLDAVRASVLLQQRVAERNAGQSTEEMRFELRIGIDTGDLVVLENGDLRGVVLNRCVRICSACIPGEVYLSDAAARGLNGGEIQLETVGSLLLKGIEGETQVYKVATRRARAGGSVNPFIWRSGITRAEDFFNRESEQNALRAYLKGQQNCQIVGPRRIGKTSLLRQIENAASKWDGELNVTYVDLQDPRCFTLKGLLAYTSSRFKWPTRGETLAEFVECVEAALSNGSHPVLCLDEFEELTARPDEFTRDFFLTLRACAQRGMSVITASRRPLSEISDRGDPTSPFYNTFPLLRLGPFAEADAEDFVNLYRPGVPPFIPETRRTILEFAKGHPLALQVACFNALEVKESGTLTDAVKKAADELKTLMPEGW
jgi:NTE family protein